MNIETVSLEIPTSNEKVISAEYFMELIDNMGPDDPALPDGLGVLGDVDLSHSDVAELPSGLKIGGNFTLDNCNSLTEIPSDLVVVGDFSANNMSELQLIGENLIVLGNFTAQDNPKLELIDSGYWVTGVIEID